VSDRQADSLDRIATVPNLLSAIRIALIPVFVLLLLDPDTQTAGLVLFCLTVATDWVDGYVARRTNQVSNLGKVLDPVADRLAIAAGLITLMVIDAVPVWAGILVLVRDALVLIVGGYLALRRGVRIDVRWIGKLATMFLMIGLPAIAWASFDLWLAPVARAGGWILYTAGIVAYYAALVPYAGDVRRALAAAGRPGGGP
jgi:cardiolipin synthase (CMP-forming)